jgi:acetyl esterase/lipase
MADGIRRSQAIGLYGILRPSRQHRAALSTHGYFGGRAPPIALLHGDRDTLVIEDVRAFAHDLLDRSGQSVVYAELPGAHHGFDLCHSIRYEAVMDAVETSAATVASDRRSGQSRGR